LEDADNGAAISVGGNAPEAPKADARARVPFLGSVGLPYVEQEQMVNP
jgi:hypothetical protein